MTNDSREQGRTRPPRQRIADPTARATNMSRTCREIIVPVALRLGDEDEDELALEAIREAIMEGRMRPGARLTLAQLSDVLGMSITPIREAIASSRPTGSSPTRRTKASGSPI